VVGGGVLFLAVCSSDAVFFFFFFFRIKTVFLSIYLASSNLLHINSSSSFHSN